MAVHLLPLVWDRPQGIQGQDSTLGHPFVRTLYRIAAGPSLQLDDSKEAENTT